MSHVTVSDIDQCPMYLKDSCHSECCTYSHVDVVCLPYPSTEYDNNWTENVLGFTRWLWIRP